MDKLTRDIKDWVSCPTWDEPKRGLVTERPKCVAPPRELCKAIIPPAIVNAVDGGEALKCAKASTARKPFNVLGQPICDDPWVRKTEQDEDQGLVLSTIGQLQRPYDLAKLAEDKGTYNTIGQKVADEVFRLPENKCEKTTLNILGQAVKPCDTVPEREKAKPRCGPAASSAGSTRRNECGPSFFAI